MTTLFMVFLFISFFGSTLAGDTRQCNDPKTLQSCYYAYFSSLKISTTKFPAYNDYLQVFNTYNTPSTLPQFCGYVDSLTSCLKDIQDDCVSPDGFSKLNILGEDIYDYPTNYGIIQYTCGDGKDAWNKIINCTTQNANAINKANTQCENTFVTTSQSCQDLVTFLECTYVLLKQDCGQDAWNFACKADSNGLKYTQPDCLGNMPKCDPNKAAIENMNFTVSLISAFIAVIMMSFQ